jgi:hypothetical protein
MNVKTPSVIKIGRMSGKTSEKQIRHFPADPGEGAAIVKKNLKTSDYKRFQLLVLMQS